MFLRRTQKKRSGGSPMGFAQRSDIVRLTKLEFWLQVLLSAPCIGGEGPANPHVLWLCAPFCQQGIEPGLPEMRVGCKGVAEVEFMHQLKAHAVRKGPFLVMVASEESGRGVETIWGNPVKLQCFAAGDGLQEIGRRRMAMPHEQQGRG